MNGKPFVRFGVFGLAALLVCSLLTDTGFPFALLLGILCLSGAVLAAYRKCGKKLISTLIAVGVLLGGFYLYERLVYAPALSLAGEKAAVSGIVITSPQKSGEVYSFTLDTTRIDLDGAPQRLKIQVYTVAEVKENERFTAVMSLKSAADRANLRAKGIFLTATVYGDTVTEPCEGLLLRKALTAVRDAVSRKFAQAFDTRTAAFADALLIGDRSGIDDADYDSVRNAGGAHLLAVSGLHLSLLAMAVFSLFALLRVPVRVNAALCGVFVLFYMALLRFSPAITRAGIMALVMFASTALIKQLDPANSLGLAVTVMLLASPFSVADAGFLLSVSATAGILIVNERIIPKIRTAAAKLPRLVAAPARKLGESVAVSAAASLSALPVSAAVFATVSTMSVLTSLLMTPIIYLLLPILAICALLPVSGFVPGVFHGAAEFLTDVFCAYTKWAGSLKYAVLPTGYLFLTVGAAAALVGLGIAAAAGALKKRPAVCLLSALLLVTSAAAAQGVAEYRLTEFTVFSDSSGSCVLIRQGQSAYLVGAGSRYDTYEVKSELERLGIKKLTALILPAAGGYASNAGSFSACVDPEDTLCAPTVDLAQPQNYFRSASLDLYDRGVAEVVVSGNGFYIEIQHDAGSLLFIGGKPDFVPILLYDDCILLDDACKKPDISYNCIYTAGKNPDVGDALLLSDAETLTVSVRTDGISLS